MSDVAADAERQTSAVARGRRPLSVWARFGILGLVALVTAGLFAWAWTGGGHKSLFATPPPGYSRGRPFDVNVGTSSSPMQSNTAPVPLPHADTPAATPAVGLQLHPMDIWTAPNSFARTPTVATGNPAGTGSMGLNTAGGGALTRPENAYAARLRATTTPDARASVMPHPEWTVPKGTIFHCLPQQPIDTQLPGPVKCLVTEDVWSADGHNILIDQGSAVNGEIQRGLDLGQNRAFILWTDLLTTHFVSVQLDSPAADDLGEVGVPGLVNEHLWAKIKAALLLTTVDTASTAATNAVQAQGTTSLSIGSYGPGLAEQALAHDINIPPTLYVSPATPLTVYVNRNLDFSEVYHDRLRAGVP